MSFIQDAIVPVEVGKVGNVVPDDFVGCYNNVIPVNAR